MKYFSALLGLFGLLLLAGPGWSQTSALLTGTIQDDKGAAVGFATVAVVKAGATASVTGTVADANGRFQLQAPVAGTYVLRISSVGFLAQETPVFELNAAAPGRDFGTLVLKADAKQLAEVNVVGLRPTIVQEADRMVVSVAGTAMAAGNTAFDVLVKSPGVFVDQDGNIQLNGKSGVTVMLDGRLTYLSARELRSMLEGMPAANLKNIEIITNPPAKYDAEGTSGILNLNLKQNTQRGLNGSVYASTNYNFQQVGHTYGASLNAKQEKWNGFVTLDASRRVGGRDATFTRIFYGERSTTYFNQQATGNFVSTSPPVVRLGADYSLTKQHSVGFMAGYTLRRGHSDFLTDTYLGSSPQEPTRYIDADNFSRSTYQNYTGNLHYNGKLDTAGTTLTADLDLVRIDNQGEADFFNVFTDLGTQLRTQNVEYTNTGSDLRIYAAKADFTRPLADGHKVEAGVKFSQVTADNDSRFYFNNGALVLDPLRTNYFHYQERIQAAYLNWSGQAGERLKLQAGLRVENTQSLGESYTTGQATRRRYLNLFPSVFAQRQVTPDYDLGFSYSRRLNRPNYGSLNPFRFYRDPYTYEEGNPFLRPQYTQAFRLTHTLRKVYSLALTYDYQTAVLSEVPILDVEAATTKYTTDNLDTGHLIGLTGVAPYKLAKWWDTQNTVVVSYRKFSTNATNGFLVNEQLYYMLQSNHTLLLPAKLRLEVEARYLGPTASGLYQIKPMHWVGIALKRSFLHDKVDVTLNANDLFKGYRYRFSTNINGNVNDFNQYFRFRSVGLTLRYNFSKGGKVDTKRRNTTLEEVNRAG
ncbi:outer membrane beta-barrel protein [Hymenobacter busanensis]|uniref:Outer membrane beta-barrel protein n=1 Tax=Hymenobacter busanensis TaxID=2607656 RepID=A0A7L4ZYU1_9BACT|nr:outer membrane beta-barrel family protein [Hymenobacter busanensis]KAA9331279.1 outer membrane beta-barrel protein [Hymenobacter busanensis]QHJ08431.1 TonB-dependent receptor [Hymenobacter busanensis]